MRYILALLVIFASLGFYSKGCFSQGETGNDIFRLPTQDTEGEYFWDFGTVEEGSILEHTFIIKNELRNTLNIKDLQASCLCTVSEVSTKSIPPGGSAEVKVKFDTQDRTGRVTQYIYVTTDDIYHPFHKLTVTAEIIKE